MTGAERREARRIVEESLDGFEIALILAWRRVSPQRREVFSAAMRRTADGQPIEDAMTEALIELGEAPKAARREAQKIVRSVGAIDFRNVLN